MNNLKTCSNCKFWLYGDCEKDSDKLSIEVEVLDDSGLDVRLCTAPAFYCSEHEEKL